MKIARSSPDRLILRTDPRLPLILLGLGLAISAGGIILALSAFPEARRDILVGALFIVGVEALLGAIFIRSATITFDRPGREVRISSRNILGAREERLPLDQVTGAAVETSRTSGTDNTPSTPTHRPVLRLVGGKERPLSPLFVSGRGAARISEAVNAWLQGAATHR